MEEGEVAGASRPTRRLTIFAVAVWALLALVVPLTALTLNAFRIASFPLGFWFAAQGCLISLSILAVFFTWKAKGQRHHEGVGEPLGFAAESISSAGFIGFAGLIAQYGYDALSFPLGLAAGLVLMAILVAPRFALYPVATVAGFCDARFAGTWTRRLLLAVTAVASILILAADVRGVGLSLQALTGFDSGLGLAVSASLITAIWLASLLFGPRRRRGLVFAFMLIALSVPLILMSLSQHLPPLPYWTFGSALQAVAAVEQGLITQKLADYRALKPLASPFLQMSNVNFAGIVLAMALGIAALPQLVGRHLARAAVMPGEAVRRAAITSVCVAVFLCGLAPFATFARAAVAQLLEGGVKVGELPAALTRASGLGWVKICGTASSKSAEIAAACAKLSGHKGLLRLQDLAFGPDSYLFSAASLSGIEGPVWVMLAAGGLLAGLAAGHAVLSGLIAAEAEKRQGARAPALDVLSASIAASVLLAAVAFAAFGSADLPSLAAEGLAIIASAVFPVLVLGLYWRRFNAAGAVATLITGLLIAGIYIFGIRLAPVTFVEWSPINSDLPPAALRKFAELKSALAMASEPAGYREVASELDRHATSIASWWGLRPPAIVVLALPAALLAGVLTTLTTTQRGPKA